MISWTRRHTALLLAVGLTLAASVVVTPAAVAASPPTAGQVLALGYNASGQLGIGSSDTDVHSTPTVVSLPSGSGAIVATSAGADHSLFAATNGLYSVGSNMYGELGVTTDAGTSTSITIPVPVTLPGQNGTVTAVAAGDDFSLALTSSGQLYTFGSDATASLGRTTSPVGSYDATPTVVSMPDGGMASQISSGQFHSLVLTSKGNVYAFGSDQYGQLGDGSTGTSDGLHAVTGLPTSARSTRVLALAAGADHSLVLSANGKVYGFGRNNDGQLGTTASSSLTTTATAITSLPSGSVSAISAGYETSMAVVGGSAYAWGDDDYGQLGYQTDSGFNPSATPHAVPLPSGATGTITGITTAALFSDVFTSSGQVVSFGSDGFGQLGRAPNANGYDSTPRLVTLPSGTTVDTGSIGGGQQDIMLPVSDVTVGPANFPSGTAGTAYSASTPTSGGLAPVSLVTLSGLPAGLYQTAGNGVAGTPTSAGTSTVSVTVSDADGVIALGNLSLTVAPAATPAPAPSPTPTPVEPTPTPSPVVPTPTPVVTNTPTTTVPLPTVPLPTVLQPSGPSASALKAALLKSLVPTGKGAHIAVLLKQGYSQSFSVLENGKAVITWTYQPPKAQGAKRAPKPIVVATATVSFTRTGVSHLTVKLTRAGSALLKHAASLKHGSLKLTLTGSFTPAAGTVVKVSKGTTLRA